MTATILIADDEQDLLDMIKDALEDEGYRVLTATDGNEIFPLLEHQPDLIVLDIMMPGLDGIEVCRAIRETVACPILFLSARREVEDRIEGLTAGGDDYLTKPFSLRELKARIAAHLRREQRSAVGREMTTLRFGNLAIDLKQRKVHVRNREVPMTGKEFDILRLLALHPGQVFSREQIYEKIWGFGEGSSATVTEHIKKIRAKLSAVEPGLNPITTVWGIGYRWEK